MTYITVFIALVLLTSQGNVYYEKETYEGEIVQYDGVPAELIEAMCAAEFDIPENKLYFTKDIEKELDQINNIKIHIKHNHAAKDQEERNCLDEDYQIK